MAGIIKLIIHKADDAYTMPNFDESGKIQLKKNSDTFPLTPNSAIVKVGMIVCTKNIKAIITSDESRGAAIPKNFINKKN